MQHTSVKLVSRKGSRDYNEDRVATCNAVDGTTVCVLADGLGGHGGGALAAQALIDALVEQCCDKPVDRYQLHESLSIANDKIKQLQQVSTAFSRMRSTVVLLHIDASSAFWLHCGDSRLYHLRGGKIISVTLDHSVSQMFVSDGLLKREDIPDHIDKNKLTRSMGGSGQESKPRIIKSPVKIEAMDRFLLCSDGWWERMSEQLLEETSITSPMISWLDDIESSFVKEPGSHYDNYSAIAVGILV